MGRILNVVECRIWMTALGRNSNNCGRSGFGRKYLSHCCEGCRRNVMCNAEFGVTKQHLLQDLGNPLETWMVLLD